MGNHSLQLVCDSLSPSFRGSFSDSRHPFQGKSYYKDRGRFLIFVVVFLLWISLSSWPVSSGDSVCSSIVHASSFVLRHVEIFEFGYLVFYSQQKQDPSRKERAP